MCQRWRTSVRPRRILERGWIQRSGILTAPADYHITRGGEPVCDHDASYSRGMDTAIQDDNCPG